MDINLQQDPNAMPWRSIYKLMIGSIVPRPIGWISSVNEAGQPNLAPFSFFNAVCPNPPHVLFCPNIRGTDSSEKDTLHNVRRSGEFVVNLVTEALAEAMNQSATEFPPHVDEFAAAGLSPALSLTVAAPRVAESPIHFECEVAQIVDISSEPGGGSVVIGKVRLLHVAESVLMGEDKIDLAALQPIGRLAGSAYCRVTDLFDMQRAPSQIAPR